MAWFDILGGVAGGLQQGLGQLQQAQQAKQVEARQQELLKLQQAQDIRAAEAAKRQEEQFQQQERDRKEASFFKEASVQDPFNVDPAFASMYPEQAKKYLAVDPKTSKVTIRMDPVKRAEAQETFARTQGRNALREQFRTPEFSTLPENERLRLGQQAAAMGMEPKEILAAVGPISGPNLRTLYSAIASPEKVLENLSEDVRAELSRKTQERVANIQANARTTGSTQLEEVSSQYNTAINNLSTTISRDTENLNKLFGSTQAIKNQRAALEAKIAKNQQKLDQYMTAQRELLGKLSSGFGVTLPAAAAPTVSADPLGLFK